MSDFRYSSLTRILVLIECAPDPSGGLEYNITFDSQSLTWQCQSQRHALLLSSTLPEYSQLLAMAEIICVIAAV